MEIRESTGDVIGFDNSYIYFKELNGNIVKKEYQFNLDNIEITNVDNNYLYFKFNNENLKIPYLTYDAGQINQVKIDETKEDKQEEQEQEEPEAKKESFNEENIRALKEKIKQL